MVEGQDLAAKATTIDLTDATIGRRPFSLSDDAFVSNVLPFALDDLSELREAEPNGDAKSAAKVELPLIINGRIDQPGDWDVFRFSAQKGARIVAEVQARRLGSPLDSMIKITTAKGRELALNDDHEDKGAGLVTHHADSRLQVTVPEAGDYLVWIGDTQRKGGRAYGYRLRVGPARPDFELRVVPSAVNARAGGTVPITVYALRRDGFSGEIKLRLKDAPEGFTLAGDGFPRDRTGSISR